MRIIKKDRENIGHKEEFWLPNAKITTALCVDKDPNQPSHQIVLTAEALSIRYIFQIELFQEELDKLGASIKPHLTPDVTPDGMDQRDPNKMAKKIVDELVRQAMNQMNTEEINNETDD